MTAKTAREKLAQLASPIAAQTALRFFKSGPGQYGEGDIFIGVKAPLLRQVAKEFRALELPEVQLLLKSKIHEERSLALLILGLQFPKANERKQTEIFDFYLGHTRHINNWDLVDGSAPGIVGAYLANRSRQPLVPLAKSPDLWKRRIAIVSTQHFIRKNEFADTIAISQILLQDKEDLIHKASGWMLREVGDRDVSVLEEFLANHGPVMPRTMLRYAIEKFPEARRKQYLKDFPPGKNGREICG